LNEGQTCIAPDYILIAESKKEEFLKFLGEFVVSEKYISHLTMDPDAFNPDSELTIDQVMKTR
jgi:acyl-CoA reductase-like NAD-dependent aldehyde dehydrogenase